MLITMISRMKKILVMLSILIILLVVSESKFSATRDAEIGQLLKKLNKPALKSIKSLDGDIIDCVHMKNHPIYDNPLFKNYTIKMRPSFYRETRNNVFLNTAKQSNMVTQLWTMYGRCPKNSIPIRRTKKEDILRVESIEKYGKKDCKHLRTSNQDNSTHEYAILRVMENVNGAKAILNVWKPYVQTPLEFSLAQMWISAGPSSEKNTIEAGWQVYPRLYGDFNPRFFILWTANGYNTYCYNLLCPGFISINREFAPGVTLTNISTLDGPQHDISIKIFKDRSGDWWLEVYDRILVGYWPSRLFNHLNNRVDLVDWGGEITNSKEGSRHTTTKMGSGHFAEERWQKASYFRNIEINHHYQWRAPTTRYTYMTNENCYNIKHNYHDTWGDYFYYGGPGRNHKCP